VNDEINNNGASLPAPLFVGAFNARSASGP
jgi:hypothetical protein